MIQLRILTFTTLIIDIVSKKVTSQFTNNTDIINSTEYDDKNNTQHINKEKDSDDEDILIIIIILIICTALIVPQIAIYMYQKFNERNDNHRNINPWSYYNPWFLLNYLTSLPANMANAESITMQHIDA
ncbi:PREDICTED: uncharacterized protein LOC105454204 [Wasmannia auropunctata]|uniref:uncharacterized protein LOC105454204 n=1 Tax=Wasmannia auropunctata TaxID=64793 RepID=UPI0005EEB30A|nr:PREDICTED: uncharacterized protein LOC105454204 [Wasmannia auropunctata]